MNTHRLFTSQKRAFLLLWHRERMHLRVKTRGVMVADRDEEFAQLRGWGDALTTEFNAVKRDHEARHIPYAEALARHKAISGEMRAVADRMRALMPEERHTPTPDSPLTPARVGTIAQTSVSCTR